MSEAANTNSDNNGDAGLNGTVNITQLNIIVLLVENCMTIISFTFARFVMVVDSGRLSFFLSRSYIFNRKYVVFSTAVAPIACPYP